MISLVPREKNTYLNSKSRLKVPGRTYERFIDLSSECLCECLCGYHTKILKAYLVGRKRRDKKIR